MLCGEPEYRRRRREEAAEGQRHADRERDEATKDARTEKLIFSIENITKRLEHSEDNTTPKNKSERRRHYLEILGLWAAAAVGLAAIVSGNHDAHEQRDVMQGQLRRMQKDGRPWVGINIIQNDPIIKAGQEFKIVPWLQNFGKSPALHVKACLSSDTPDLGQQDKQGILKLLTGIEERCDDPIETILMPNAQFPYPVTRPANLMTSIIADDINGGKRTFSVVGRVVYSDDDGATHRTRFCVLYAQSIAAFRFCPEGNSAD